MLEGHLNRCLNCGDSLRRRTIATLLLLVLLTPLLAGCQWNPSAENHAEEIEPQVKTGTQVTIQLNWTSADSSLIGRINLNLCPLRPDHVASFLAHVEDQKFDGTPVHRIIPEMYIAAGDFEQGDGTGGHAGIDGTGIGGEPENWTVHPVHSPSLYHGPGVLTTGTDGNTSWGSVFLMLGEKADFSVLDDSHVPFGRVADNASLDQITEISEFNRGAGNRPRPEVNILTIIPKSIDYDIAMDACIREAWKT